YAVILLAGRFYFGYSFKDLGKFRAQVWEKLSRHDGPVIWAANHLTLIDSFLIFWAVFPWHKMYCSRLVPWSTPEYRNYYFLGGPLRQRMVRFLMYLCRCIPFLREGEDEASVRWRQMAFEKCVWLLRHGGSVFIYPEAGRSRSGWFEAKRPKDFLGRMALEVPAAKFLCVYLRGENQLYTTVYPAKGERFLMRADLIDGVLPGETNPRAISERLFNKLAELQLEWFKDGAWPRNCGGNDVVDLKSEKAREHFDLEANEVDWEWVDRHLTPKELAYLRSQQPAQIYFVFWKFFAAKEASHKALAQSGLQTPVGAYGMLEVDLFRRQVVHLPTGCQVEVAFTDDDADKIHCIAVLRGGFIGDEDNPGDVLWKVDEVPADAAAQDYAREQCLKFIAQSSDEIPSPSVLAFSEQDGIPKILRSGKICDWGVSLSHSGRFAAYSFMIS
ncbi:MAG: hypothetical protein A3J74_04145, partial [Elusimicrobia bacterium RIFCSPHIGHO2_02_FULL_57_9]